MKNILQKGFTLIELLVVIAIIGLLSSFVLASLSGARASARDVRRQQSVNQLRTAIEMYINQNGEVPADGEWGNSCPGTGSLHDTWLDLESDLEPYINGEVRDPVNDPDEGSLCFDYNYPGAPGGNCQYVESEMEYTILFRSETKEDGIENYIHANDSSNLNCVISQ